MYKNSLKICLDITFAFCLLILISPLMLVLSVIIMIYMKTSPFFIQNRVGYNNKIFKLYKFKTMSEKRDSFGVLLPDKDRLTNFGRLLRKLSVDELPQLFNVILCDMSLVGPRPLLISYLPLYTPEQASRHNVRPGLTGLAQVSGRNSLDWESKFKFDVYYVNNISFFLDLKILLLTVWKVLTRDGITSASSHTMEPFKGSSQGNPPPLNGDQK